MSRLNIVLRRLYLAAIVFGTWFAVEGTVWAKKAAEKTEDSGSSPTLWVISYALILLCIGLGMLVVCRSASRSDRTKPQQYEALKTND
jgi:hypothetical protein